MYELDFSGKTVLVVGGSSGIGNGIAQNFRQRGAEVHVWGTRASAAAYHDSPDSNLEGLHYAQVDVADAALIEAVCVPIHPSGCVGASAGECSTTVRNSSLEGLQARARHQPHQPDGLRAEISPAADGSQGFGDHGQFGSSVPFYPWQPCLQLRLENRRFRADSHLGRPGLMMVSG